MKVSITSVRFFLALALIATPLAAFLLEGTDAMASSSYFTSNCAGCHAAPVVATCNGCHAHGTHSTSAKSDINVAGTTNKSSYAPGETVSVTINGGYRTGWIRAVLYDQTSKEVARSTGTASGMVSSTIYPATLTAPAPATAGTYTWKVAWYGNKYDKATPFLGTGWTPDPTNANHGYQIVNMASFTVTAPGDTTAPVVGTFTLPTTATSLTVPVSALSATDNLAVTGYLITTSATVPSAGAVGWSATVPTSATAAAAGSVTFYAWAKDAAGNVSAGKSASVTITLPDGTAPVVDTFTLPATATSLTVPVSALSATDNLAVTGYLITTSATVPSAGDAGWSASVPTSATAAAAGSVTFYAWAKDAAGNVSNPMSATVIITLDTAAPTVDTFTLPATATSISVPVSAFTAHDNVAVTGYLVTSNNTIPAASATGWSASASNFAIASVTGSVTFYAWAKDAAGNVSASKNATVEITIDLTKVMPGDVNFDKVVNVFDALLTLQNAVGLYQPAPAEAILFKTAADVAPLDATGKPMGNTAVDVFDALAILRHAVGLDAWAANVIVPNVVNQTQLAAQSTITGVGLVVGAVTTASSSSVASGSVISQNPLAGVSVAAGTAVTLVVSSGSAQITVPNVVGQTTAAVQTAVSAASLVVGTVIQQHHATVPNGKVLSQSPSAGTIAAAGASVSLTISSGPTPASSQYAVVAWNDLGMHCLNPSFDTAVILPPYNTIWAQVIKRGTPPQIITSGISIDYRIINNTTSVSPVKGTFAQFWDKVYMNKLFGVVLPQDYGLNLVTPTLNNSLTGSMVQPAGTNHFMVNGIPVTPINDFGVKSPYQVAEITVKDTAGIVLAQTQATVPTSDEFSCGKCHTTDDPNPFKDMLIKHDRNQGTSLVSSMPVLCASCHGSPALGTTGPGSSGKYLSQAIHGFHSGKTVPGGTAIGCNDCHPGPTAKCNRSAAHSDITKVVPAVGSTDSCSNINCHGTLSKIADDISSGVKIPWLVEPKCVNCHATGFNGSSISQVDTGNATDGSALYRSSKGHGGLSCAACHSSPHAVYPVDTINSLDKTGNYQALQYQGAAKTLGSCNNCHGDSRGGGTNILEEHGSGIFEGKTISCGICHSGFSNPATSNWPHGYTWKGRP